MSLRIVLFWSLLRFGCCMRMSFAAIMFASSELPREIFNTERRDSGVFFVLSDKYGSLQESLSRGCTILVCSVMNPNRESILSDSWQRTLTGIPTFPGRLAYLASLRNVHSGVYEHFGLSQRVAKERSTACCAAATLIFFRNGCASVSNGRNRSSKSISRACPAINAKSSPRGCRWNPMAPGFPPIPAMWNASSTTRICP